MSQKKHPGGPAPVPPGNRPHGGPAHADVEAPDDATGGPDGGASHQEQGQDPQRRLGDFAGKGEHPRVVPNGGRGNKDR